MSSNTKGNKANERVVLSMIRTETPKPLVWMSKKRGIDNSGGGQAWVTSDKWGPLEDQLLHLSYGQSKMYVVLKEEKNGQVQGGVARIPVDLEQCDAGKESIKRRPALCIRFEGLANQCKRKRWIGSYPLHRQTGLFAQVNSGEEGSD